MDIIRVADLSEDEYAVLMKAGEIIGSIGHAVKEDDLADKLSDKTTNMLEALKAVIIKTLGE